MARHKQKLSHKRQKVQEAYPQEAKSLSLSSPSHSLLGLDLPLSFLAASVMALSFTHSLQIWRRSMIINCILVKKPQAFPRIKLEPSFDDVSFGVGYEMSGTVMKTGQVLTYSRRTSHCWVLYHPEGPVEVLPLSGDHIFCSFYSMDQIFPMTAHHLVAQLHLSIWSGCCWLLCHHLLLETSLFSVKRKPSSLLDKLGIWSRYPTCQKKKQTKECLGSEIPWEVPLLLTILPSSLKAPLLPAVTSTMSCCSLWSLTLSFFVSLSSKDAILSLFISHQNNTRKSQIG